MSKQLEPVEKSFSIIKSYKDSPAYFSRVPLEPIKKEGKKKEKIRTLKYSWKIFFILVTTKIHKIKVLHKVLVKAFTAAFQ
jgi:hypothetical protein